MAVSFSVLINISCYSVFIGAILGVVRYKKIPQTYLPFLILIWMGSANEVLSSWFIEVYHSNAVNSNVYVLFEFAVILYQFFKWNTSSFKTYVTTAIIGLIIWIADDFFIFSIKDFDSFFRIYYYLVIVYLSLVEINKLLISNLKRIIYNERFLICITFLLYYSYNATFEIFFLVPLTWSKRFYTLIDAMFILVNFIANILFALAILCIPKKQKFTLKY